MKLLFLSISSVAIVVSFLAATIFAQSQTDETSNDNSKGTITGRVVDQNGQPLVNAVVNAYSYGNTGRRGMATTDREGNFQIGGLEPFAYMVEARVPGYVARPRDPDVNPIGFYRVGDSARIELMKGGVITGSVKRANGDPVVSVNVRAYMIRDNKGQRPRYGIPASERPTDDRGVYRIYGLRPGTYIVLTGGSGHTNGYTVDPYTGDVPTYAPSSPRDAATELLVNSGEELANVDIRYREVPGHTVSGTANSAVTDPQSGISIVLTSILNGAAQEGYNAYQDPRARGFVFSGIADGEYDVMAQQYAVAAEEWLVSEPRRIQVRGADVSGLEFIVRPLSSIAGSVVLEESKLPECAGKHRPLAGETLIGAWHNEKTVAKDDPQFLWSLGSPTLPAKDGKFILRSLAPGQYRFNVRPLAKYWYLKSISWPGGTSSTAAKDPTPDRPRDAARNWTNVRMGERLTGLTVTFAEGAASLHGKVEAAEGKKLPSRLFIYLTPAEPGKAEDVVRYFVSLAAEDGGFTLTSLPPGRYWMSLAPAADSDSNMMSKLRLPDETELRAKLRRDGEAAKLQIELKPCQNLSDYQLAFK
jgi:hypothetical protein